MSSILRASVAYLQTLPPGNSLNLGKAAVIGVTIAGNPNAGIPSTGCGFAIDASGQTLTCRNDQNWNWPAISNYSPGLITVNLALLTGKVIRTNSDFVVNATDDLATELRALGWTTFVPPGNYQLSIPVS